MGRGDVLVIGFGNTLRRDDGLGPAAAEAVARWGLPGVVAIATHQLLPELAEPLANARLALFVDAHVAEDGEAVLVRPIEPAATDPATGHTSDPRRLLALARGVFGASPRSWAITVPAPDLGLGEGFSPTARAALEIALRRIAEILTDAGVEVGPGIGGPCGRGGWDLRV